MLVFILDRWLCVYLLVIDVSVYSSMIYYEDKTDR